LCLERVRVRRAPDLGRGADGAALHPDHYRRGRPGLACSGGRHHAVPDPDRAVHHPAPQAPAARHHLRSGAQMSEQGPTLEPPVRNDRARRWSPRATAEHVATALIALGVIMLMQPFSLTLYGYSFITTLVGTVLFVVGSKLPE